MEGTRTSLVLVRHGETDWNLIHRLQGITDTQLTETGVLQAERVARRLMKRDIKNIYSSDLSRALNTAKLIAGDSEIMIDERLREFDIGIFAGHTQSEARKKYPVEWNEYLTSHEFSIPQGESYQDFIKRTTSALEEICNRHQGENICVVTHGGVIDCVRRYLLNDDGDYQRCHNASLSEFLIIDGNWKLVTWNDASHLARLKKPLLVADDVIRKEDSEISEE